jgi:hypothetical protein
MLRMEHASGQQSPVSFAHAQNGICRISIRATAPDLNLRMLTMEYVEFLSEKQSHSLTAHAREMSIRATVPDLILRMLRMEYM